MSGTEPLVQLPDQLWVVNRQNLTRWRFHVDSKVREIGEDRVQPRLDALRLGQVRWLRGPVWMAETGTVKYHLHLLASRQVGEPAGSPAAPKGE